MKHIKLISLTITLLLTIMSTSSMQGQITTIKTDVTAPANSDMGFYYSLPQTTFTIKLVYEEVNHIKGPLASYASEFLGISDIITTNSTEYNLIDVKVSSYEESDPEEVYFVKFPSERAKDSKPDNFYMSSIGGLLSYNVTPVENDFIQVSENNINYYFESESNDFPYQSQYNKRKKTDSILRQISIDTIVIDRFIFNTTWVDKTDEDQAKEAALQIEKIRESRYNLISGYHEINYGESIMYMDNQLKKMEDSYLDLFTGKTRKSIKSETIIITPKTTQRSKEILSFNNGKSVFLSVKDSKTEQSPNSPAINSNSVYYRVPAVAEFEVTFDNQVFFKEKFVVNQLGNVYSVSLKNAKVQFSSKTGNIVNIYQE